MFPGSRSCFFPWVTSVLNQSCDKFRTVFLEKCVSLSQWARRKSTPLGDTLLIAPAHLACTLRPRPEPPPPPPPPPPPLLPPSSSLTHGSAHTRRLRTNAPPPVTLYLHCTSIFYAHRVRQAGPVSEPSRAEPRVLVHSDSSVRCGSGQAFCALVRRARGQFEACPATGSASWRLQVLWWP